MLNLVYFRVLARNRLAVKPCTTRRHKPATQFLDFLDELLGSDGHPPGDVSNLARL
ncbi:hypothetical protein DEO72_LG10g2768 [Vigna unguiculata]|uniref:Uncharacterized protein n=1 Tax=Vigna unguiculata TaxID=3917 RepID=A0A4D6NH69_VIGUN|nr:hypothetical protein DEO72_LG10g2768 [Vigna unguiculata]